MKLGDFQKLMQERPNPRPCVHPYSPANTSLARAPGGLHLRYHCPHCDEQLPDHWIALKGNT